MKTAWILIQHSGGPVWKKQLSKKDGVPEFKPAFEFDPNKPLLDPEKRVDYSGTLYPQTFRLEGSSSTRVTADSPRRRMTSASSFARERHDSTLTSPPDSSRKSYRRRTSARRQYQ
jgi:hypothetical protein